VKRVWAKVNTQLGELVFGRMGYHWGLGVLHNDGNCLDCDFGDTYDRVAFSPRDFKGHKDPAQGFLDFNEAVVAKLIGVGLTWGGTYPGAKDMMHFDLREGDGAKINTARKAHKNNQ